jgi:hypothetical protein
MGVVFRAHDERLDRDVAQSASFLSQKEMSAKSIN